MSNDKKPLKLSIILVFTKEFELRIADAPNVYWAPVILY